MRTGALAAVVAAILAVSVASSVAYIGSLPVQQGVGGTGTSTIFSASTSVLDTVSQVRTSSTSNVSSAHSPFPSGTMGIEQAIAMMRALPAYTRVNASANTVAFGSQSVDIVVLAAMPDDAANITGLQPPPYATGDVFVVGGLIDPTLMFQKGASVSFTVVNIDDDMYHNFVLTTISPPYGYMMMASGGMGPGMMYDFLSTMPLMAPANYQQRYAYAYSYSLTLGSAGDYWNVCTYPGHAQGGMYGELIAG